MQVDKDDLQFVLKQLLKGKYPVQIASESLGKFSGRQIAIIMRFHGKDEHYKALVNAPEKFCPRCNQVLDKHLFHTNLENLDGLAVYCKECRNETERERAKKKFPPIGKRVTFDSVRDNILTRELEKLHQGDVK